MTTYRLRAASQSFSRLHWWLMQFNGGRRIYLTAAEEVVRQEATTRGWRVHSALSWADYGNDGRVVVRVAAVADDN